MSTPVEPKPPRLSLEALARIDEVCTRFEQAQQTGETLSIEAFVEGFEGPERQQLLLELLLLDLDRRGADKLEDLEAEYRRRFRSDHSVIRKAIATHHERYEQQHSSEQTVMLSEPPSHPTQEDVLPEPDEDEPQRIRYFGEYEIHEEIARGGMGVVFKARQRTLKRTIALKMILTGRLADQSEIDRFHREAQAASRLNHSHIVSIHEVGEHKGRHYFTMDYIDGPSLADVLREETLAPLRAANLVRTIAEAVHYAHGEGTVHRDLKPANVLLSKDGTPHVTDFGLAKVFDERDEDSWQRLTATGQVVGTPSYMSPEQAAGKGNLVGPASDIWSLGAILYACLTGRPPFLAETQVDTILQVMHKEPVPPSELNPAVPKDLETICLKCLNKEPHRRYGTAHELADDLQRFVEGRPVLARPVGRVVKLSRWAKRNPIVALLTALSVLLLISGSGVSLYFAMQAENRAAEAIQAKNDADDAKEAALDAEAKALREAERARNAESELKIEKEAAETLAEDKANLARTEQKLRLKSERDNVALMFEQGYQLCRNGNPRDGLLWLERSLRGAIELGDQKLEESIRWQIGSYRKQLCIPTAQCDHEEILNRVTVSADGSLLLTLTGNSGFQPPHPGTLQLWDVGSDKKIGKPLGTDLILAEFSNDAKYIYAVTSENQLLKWDTATRNQIGAEIKLPDVSPGRILPGPNHLVAQSGSSLYLFDLQTGQSAGKRIDLPSPKFIFFFSDDGTLMITVHRKTGQNDSVARVWDMGTGQQIGSQFIIPHHVQSCTVHPGKELCLITGTSYVKGQRLHMAQLWNLRTAQAVGEPLAAGIGLEHGWGTQSARFSLNGQFFAIATPHHGVGIWRTSDRQPVCPYLMHDDDVIHLQFSHDSTRLLTSSEDRRVQIWNVRTGQRLFQPINLPWRSTGFFSKSDDYVITVGKASHDATVRFWKLPAQNMTKAPLNFEGAVTQVESNPSGDQFAVAYNSSRTGGGVLSIRQVPSMRQTYESRAFRTPVDSLAWHPGNKFLIAGDSIGSIQLWDPRSGQMIAQKLPEYPNPRDIEWLHHRDQCLILNRTEKLTLLDFTDPAKPSGHALALEGGEAILDCAISQNDEFCFAGGWQKSAQTWTIDDWQTVGNTISTNGSIQSVDVSTTHRLAITGGESQSANLWEIPSGNPVGIPMHHRGSIRCVAFHPTAPIVATAADDRVVKFWEISTQNQIGPDLVHDGRPSSIAFCDRGQTLLVGLGGDRYSAVAEGTVYSWNVPQPANEDVDTIRLQLEWYAGKEITDDGVLRPLTAQEISNRRDLYRQRF